MTELRSPTAHGISWSVDLETGKWRVVQGDQKSASTDVNALVTRLNGWQRVAEKAKKSSGPALTVRVATLEFPHEQKRTGITEALLELPTVGVTSMVMQEAEGVLGLSGNPSRERKDAFKQQILIPEDPSEAFEHSLRGYLLRHACQRDAVAVERRLAQAWGACKTPTHQWFEWKDGQLVEVAEVERVQRQAASRRTFSKDPTLFQGSRLYPTWVVDANAPLDWSEWTQAADGTLQRDGVSVSLHLSAHQPTSSEPQVVADGVLPDGTRWRHSTPASSPYLKDSLHFAQTAVRAQAAGLPVVTEWVAFGHWADADRTDRPYWPEQQRTQVAIVLLRTAQSVLQHQPKEVGYSLSNRRNEHAALDWHQDSASRGELRFATGPEDAALATWRPWMARVHALGQEAKEALNALRTHTASEQSMAYQARCDEPEEPLPAEGRLQTRGTRWLERLVAEVEASEALAQWRTELAQTEAQFLSALTPEAQPVKGRSPKR